MAVYLALYNCVFIPGPIWRQMVIEEISEKLTELVQPFYISPSDDLEAICTAIAGLPHEIKDRIAEHFGQGVKKMKMVIEELQQNGWRRNGQPVNILRRKLGRMVT